MATQVFLVSTVATTHRGTNTANLRGTTVGWVPLGTNTSRGSGLATASGSTVTGPTAGVEVIPTSVFPGEWLTPPVDQDVTISGTVTGNIWAQESSMNANAAINFRVDKVAATDGTLTEVVRSARTTELGFSGSNTVQNFTASPTSTVVNKGDRLRITIFGDDAGTMASGSTFSIGYNGTTASADGDTYITFNETFGFQTTDPTGTTIYLTNTASAVATADTDWEAWTARGDSAFTIGGTGLTGWISPFQLRTTGPSNISWFTRPLQAFTLSGLVKCNVRAGSGVASANCSVGVEIARVDGDGTNATVWGYANRDAATTSGGAGEVATAETAYTVYVSGDDLAITDGQRLRIRTFMDDCADIPVANTGSTTVWIDGPTGGASGDTFLIFGQTLTESIPGTAYPFERVDRTAVLRDTDPWSATGWRQ